MFDAIRYRRRLTETRSLLETERRLLREGDVEGLARLNAQRDSALDGLLDIPEDFLNDHRREVEGVRRLAERNGRLLRSYLEGARQAAARVMELEAKSSEIGAYRADGSRLEPRGKSGAALRQKV